MRAIHVLLSLLLSVGIASVFPETYGHEPKGHKFIPAGPGDSRSPCPWLNALANHDYLPRNGRRITEEMVEKSFEDTLNFAPGSLEGATVAAITTGKGDGTFDLADTVKHNVLEHDASWSRNDVAIGDALVFDPIIWNRTASHFKSATISVDSVAAARLDRIATAQALNPLFNLTPDGLTATFANHALWLVSFGDRVKGDASTLFTRVVFEQERLPFKEGFVRPSTPIVGSDVANMVKKLQSATIRVGLAKIPEHGGHSEHRG